MTAREPLLKPSKPSKLPLHRRSAGHTFKTLETGIKVVFEGFEGFKRGSQAVRARSSGWPRR